MLKMRHINGVDWMCDGTDDCCYYRKSWTGEKIPRARYYIASEVDALLAQRPAPMTLERARKIVGGVDEFMRPEGREFYLDGRFTAEQLEAIATLMRASDNGNESR